jgi:iron(III) transport system ATP-binding protein
MSSLTLKSIGKSYDRIVALDNIDLEVPANSRTAIVGPSASGKTTLLRIVAGFETPDTGVIALDGRVMADRTHSIPPYRRGIGFIAQDGALFPHLSVGANIAFGLDQRGVARTKRIEELLDIVGLNPGLVERRPHQLSGGQQQRVAIARALAQRPRLMLLDEPFSALDAGLREDTRRTVAHVLKEAGVTTILVTHDQVEALSFADQVAILQNGRLAQCGAPRELYFHPCSIGVATYLGDAIILSADVADGWARTSIGTVQTTSKSRGRMQIMLRPEQITLIPEDSTACAEAQTDRVAKVVDVDFAGAVSIVTIELCQPADPKQQPATAQRLALRQAGFDLPLLGNRVRVNVNGLAHVFCNSSAD